MFGRRAFIGGAFLFSTASRWAKAQVPSPERKPITRVELLSPHAGTADFAFAVVAPKGLVATGIGVTTDANSSQCIVKKTWNDGSAKHILVAGTKSLQANRPGTVTIWTGTPAGGMELTAADIGRAAPVAVADCGVLGSVSLTPLLANPTRTWISGREMVECHYGATSSGGVLVLFYVRLWKSGRMWVGVTLHNGWVDVYPFSDLAYTATVSVGGSTVYGPVRLANHNRLTDILLEGWIGGDPQITPRHDTADIVASRLMPNIKAQPPSENILNELHQKYVPPISDGAKFAYDSGGWTRTMGDTGAQDQIGLVPQWDALFIASGGDSRAYNSVIANAKCLFSYPIGYRGKSDNAMPARPSVYPSHMTHGTSDNNNPPSIAGMTITLSGTFTTGSATITNVSPNPVRAGVVSNLHEAHFGFDAIVTRIGADSIQMSRAFHGPSGTGSVQMVSPLGWDSAHFGAGGYLAYLLTGDYRFLELQQYQCAVCWLWANKDTGLGVDRALLNSQERAVAWKTRTVAQYLALGTEDKFYADLTKVLQRYVRQMLEHVRTNASPLGICYYYAAYDDGTDRPAIAPWQINFQAQVQGFCSEIDCLPDVDAAAWNEIRDYLYKFPVGLLGDASGYCFNYASAYTLVVGPSGTRGPTSLPSWYDFATVFSVNFPSAPCGNELRGGSGGAATNPMSYWRNLLPAIALAVDHHAPGAVAAFGRLTHASNWRTVLAASSPAGSAGSNPEWVILPRA